MLQADGRDDGDGICAKAWGRVASLFSVEERKDGELLTPIVETKPYVGGGSILI